ncbi:hypothetical protein NYE48_16620 [Paenibacillus sp. FSL M7-1455]|uniref:hypothetical protein n=1 Tax=Paenibacillus sp. FSL M7-1455 TaxID=2975316 RepID=UPI0030FAAC9D
MLRERIRTWIESYDRNGYLNGSILVAGNGHRIVNEGFGMANREHGVANTPSTKFRIGSFRFSASGGASTLNIPTMSAKNGGCSRLAPDFFLKKMPPMRSSPEDSVLRTTCHRV